MNEKEVAEIRRRFKPEKSNITHIRGCLVNENREIVTEFDQSVALMPQEDAELFLTTLKRTLSGTLNKNLIDIEFSTQQVVDSTEHKLLMTLRDSELQDVNALHYFYETVVQSVHFETSYFILLATDTYDVSFRGKDGMHQEDASAEVFRYFLCSICPVKSNKPALSYNATENEFHASQEDWIVSPPELGFLFPAFDDRSTNIYNALYYSRNTADSHDGFVEAIFRTPVPMPAQAQQESFQSMLGSLGEACDFDLVQSVQGQLQDLIVMHKENKEEDPLLVSKSGMSQILRQSGVPEARVEQFAREYDQQFGEDKSVSPKNLLPAGKKTEIASNDVKIQINAERGDLVETRRIGGINYILIRAEGSVELNGVPVHINETTQPEEAAEE